MSVPPKPTTSDTIDPTCPPTSSVTKPEVTITSSTLAATAVFNEVEAYLGLTDPASYGLTPNNAVLFSPPGRAHLYFIYGMYYCLNVSSHLPGEAGGVLIRAIIIGE